MPEAVERVIRAGSLKKMLAQRHFSCLKISRIGGWLMPKTTIAKMSKTHSMDIIKLLMKIEKLISHVPIMNLFFSSFLLVAQKDGK